MNTIPLTFDERQVNRTVVGGTEPCPGVQMPGVSVVVLNSGGTYFRRPMLENLARSGFASIVSIERGANNYGIEEFVRAFPFVKFIVPLEDVTDGDLINIGMGEVKSDYVLVIRDSLSFSGDLLNANLAARITEGAPYCVVPRMLLHRDTAFPIIFSPSVKQSVFTVESTAVVSEGLPTLYPYDCIGLYNRRKFIDLGGFDHTITSPYWQNLDLSMRAWLWGERIVCSPSFLLSYGTDLEPVDTTANQSSNRFYLKNLAPKFVRDHGVIPRLAFWIFWPRSACGVFEAHSQFAAARAWVNRTKYRFKLDAIDLVENWYKIQR